MTINERIKIRAKELGMTVEEVEQKCGLGKRTIYSWDKSSPSVDKVKRVADLLDTTPAYIMGWEGENDEILERLARFEKKIRRFLYRRILYRTLPAHLVQHPLEVLSGLVVRSFFH